MAAVNFLQANANTSTLTTYTFSGENIGTASGGRYVFVGVTGRSVVGGGIASATIGGITATIDVSVVNSSSNYTTAGIIKAAVPTGTTGDVVITFSSEQLRCGIGVWYAPSISTATPTSTGSSTAAAPTANMDVNDGGFIVACAYNATTSTATWTNLTEQYDATIVAGAQHSGASVVSGSDQTGLACTCTWTASGQPAGAFAAYDVLNVTTQPAFLLNFV